MAWRNLLRGWRRSGVVLIAIGVGLAACLVLVAYTHGFMRQMAENAVSTRLAHLAVHAAGYQENPDPQRSLPDDGREIVAALERLPGAHASPRLVGEGLLQSSRRSARAVLVGVDPVREARVSIIAKALIEGHMPTPTPIGVARRIPGIAIGASMAELLRVGVGDKVVMHVPGEEGLGAFRVSGIFRTASSEFDKSTGFVRLEEAQHLLALPGRVTEVAVALDDPTTLLEAQAKAASELARVNPALALEVLTWQEREPRMAAMLELMASTSWILYAAVFVAMAFGIANALLMMVYERIREFGMLRALGLQARSLLVLVVLESLLLTALGALLGLAIGVPIVLWFGHAGLDMTRFAAGMGEFGIGTRIYLELERSDVVLPLVVAVVTGLLAALWPAWKAVRLRPAEAIRHV